MVFVASIFCILFAVAALFGLRQWRMARMAEGESAKLVSWMEAMLCGLAETAQSGLRSAIGDRSYDCFVEKAPELPGHRARAYQVIVTDHGFHIAEIVAIWDREQPVLLFGARAYSITDLDQVLACAKKTVRDYASCSQSAA
jgi:hypothetical protein